MAQNVLSDENADMASCNLWPGFQQIARSRKKFSGPCDELFFFCVFIFFYLRGLPARSLHSLRGIWQSLNVCGSNFLWKVTSVSAHTEEGIQLGSTQKSKMSGWKLWEKSLCSKAAIFLLF